MRVVIPLQLPCLFLFPSSVVADCYIWWYWYVGWIGYWCVDDDVYIVYRVWWIMNCPMGTIPNGSCISGAMTSILFCLWIWFGPFIWMIVDDNNWLVYLWWLCWILSSYLLNFFSCPCQTFPTSIITTLSYQALTYLLVVVVIYIYIYILVQFVCDTM